MSSLDSASTTKEFPPEIVYDEHRLDALRRYDVLDTEPEPAFDRITRLASHLFEMPTSIINFVSDERQWFKSTVGFDETETGLDVSFCVYTVEKGEVLVVEDLAEDDRFADNPFVTDRGVRFYAGAPLLTPDDERIGTICVLDTEPRFPSEEKLERLSDLAAMVIDELELRREQQKLQETQERYRILVDNFPGGVFLYDETLCCHLAGGKALTDVGLDSDEIEGASPHERYPSKIAEPLTDSLQAALEGRENTLVQSYQGRQYRVHTVPIERQNSCMAVSLDVTKQKEAEKKRRRSRERYQSLFHDSNDAILVHDLEGTIQEVNPAAESLFELEAEKLKGKSLLDLHASSETETAREKLSALRAGRSYQALSQYERADGTEFWGQVSVTTTELSGEKVVRTLIQDVTEREESRRKLEQYREYTGRLLDAIEDLFFVLDEKARFRRWNDRFPEVTGYDDAEIGDMTAFDLVPERERERLAATIAEGFESGYAQIEAPLLLKDGTTVPYEFVGNLVEHPEGERQAVGIGRDITERKKAERELRRSEQRFRKIFENAAIGIAIVDDEGRPLQANPALQSMLGYSEEELQHLHFTAATHPDDVDKDLVLFKELNEGKRDQYRIDKRYVRKDGEVFWGRLTFSRLDVDDGTKHVSLVENISEQKRHERAIRQAKDEAENVARLKSIMLANMSHEIRTPLTSMIGLSGLLEEQLEGRAAKLARLIYKSGQRLEKTMEAALDLSQLEAGSYTPDRTSLPLASLARRIADEFEVHATDSGVSVQVKASGEPAEAYADEMAVRRVLSNLLDNAIKFTPEKGEVTIRTYVKDSKMVTVEVEDTGVGISEEALPRIFEPFKQESEGLTREYEGAGLGLSIVQGLVEVLGGKIEVDTEKGEGTCISVHLPRPTEQKSG